MKNNSNKDSEYLLVVKGLKKSFHTKSGTVKAIDDVSFNVRPGEIMGLIGESGSGKTTVGRLLIRLYNDFSGFISLDNQIISGKRISKKRSLFLHKNMQMIFQDPHASLDGQQNVYSILKEPLIVNKIMKNEYKDIFSDWQEVLKNFKYPFEKEVKNIELSNMISLNHESKSFIDEWQDQLLNLKFDFKNNKIDNIFNSYYSFLDSRQLKESYYVKKLFDNNDILLKKYFESQEKYRNNDLNSYESKLKNYKEKLNLTMELSTQSLNKYLTIKEQERIKNEIIEDQKRTSEYITNTTNMLLSQSLEYKNAYLSANEKANKTSDYIKHNDAKTEYFLYKHVYREFTKNINKLTYLEINNIEELINMINDSIISIQKTFIQVNMSDPKYLKKIKYIIASEFDLGMASFINISRNNKKTKLFERYEQKLALDEKKKTISIKTDPHKSKIDILSAKKDYQNTIDELNWNLKIYLENFNVEMRELQNEIDKESEFNKSLHVTLDNLNVEFDLTHKRFLKELELFLAQSGKTKEKISQQINFYDNKVKQKHESLKSFHIEVKNLQDDFIKMKHLVGIIQNKFSKPFVKKILLKEKIYKALEDVGLLRQFAWRYPHEFSGGQRQRIVIARAIISEPKLIIADEPIASLDISIQAQVVNLLKDLCKTKNMALIFIAHDLSMVEYIADRINIMHLGKIVEYGETSKVYDKPVHPYTINLFNSIPKISNANKPFEASGFELEYLEEQQDSGALVTDWKCSKDHYVYSTEKQFKKWMGMEVEEVEIPVEELVYEEVNNDFWNDSMKIQESLIIDVKKR
ncbi:MAG: ATP-binding cassette domain-containing protein [Metamycoplasmataceae bacterium]